MVAVAGGADIRCAPYACFGTQALSDYALKALEGRNACLLAHHGLIVLAENFARALWLATEVEVLAKMYVHALAIGEPPLLSMAEMAQVIEQIQRMKHGEAPDLDDVCDAPRKRGAHKAVRGKIPKQPRRFPRERGKSSESRLPAGAAEENP